MTDADTVLDRLKNLDKMMLKDMDTITQIMEKWYHELANIETLTHGWHELAQEREALIADLAKRKDCDDV